MQHCGHCVIPHLHQMGLQSGMAALGVMLGRRIWLFVHIVHCSYFCTYCSQFISTHLANRLFFVNEGSFIKYILKVRVCTVEPDSPSTRVFFILKIYRMFYRTLTLHLTSCPSCLPVLVPEL